jgi:Helix-turn-helix domain
LAFVADSNDPAAGSPRTALPRLLSIGDVAALFDRSARTLRRWIRLGHLVPVRVGGELFFDPDDIRRLIAGRLCAAVLAR